MSISESAQSERIKRERVNREAIKSDAPTSAKDRATAAVVFQALEEFCRVEKAGTLLPTYSELRENFKASDRAVRWALEELERSGKLSRRRGARMSVADVSSLPAQKAINHRTVIAITQPDHSFFDYAIHLLYGIVKQKKLNLQCHFAQCPFDETHWSGQALAVESPLGFVIFRRDLLPLARQLHDLGQRVVVVGRPPEGEVLEIPNIYSNHEQGGYQATRHLLELGHLRLAFRGYADVIKTERWCGHQRAIKEATRQGQTIDESLIDHEQFEQWRHQPELAREYFSRPDAPTAIVAWNDQHAIEMLTLLNFIGVRVPEDVSLIGHDNLPASKKVFPALTTIDTNLEQQLEAALESLIVAPNPATPLATITVPTLICRDSTAAPKSYY